MQDKFWRSPFSAAIALVCILFGCSAVSVAASRRPTVYTAWGDSLTAGCEDGTWPACAYPWQLGQLIGASVANEGIGGQTSAQIAVRMGAVPTNVTDAFTIPATGSVSGVTFKSGYEPCGHDGWPGQVEGVIDGVPVYCQDAGGGTFTLTRVYPGFAAQNVNSGDAWFPVLPPGTLEGLNLIWAGENDSSLCPTSGVTTANCPAAANIAAMTSWITLHHGRYLVLTVINGEDNGYPPYSEAYNQIVAIDSWILAAYPNESVDVRAALVAAYDPQNPVDVIAHSHDVPPFTLRAFDNSGSLAAPVSATSTCAITFGTDLSATVIVSIGSEYIYINGGNDGNYNCTRGYAGSTPETYASGTPWIGADPLHLSGAGTRNTENPNGPGYTLVAKSVYNALLSLAAHGE